MPRQLLPKYKCELIALQVNRLLRLSPPLTWRQVRDFAEPQLPGLTRPTLTVYDPELRRLVAQSLMREIKHQHVWSG